MSTFLLLVLLATPSCTSSIRTHVGINCKIKPISKKAAFCSKTLAMNFGPADQFVGYSIVRGQVVAILKAETAESILAEKIINRKTFIKDIQDVVIHAGVIFYESGIKGENSLSINPGRYVICSQSKKYPSIDQPILSCEPAYLKMNKKYKLLITDNPRAGIHFEWK